MNEIHKRCRQANGKTEPENRNMQKDNQNCNNNFLCIFFFIEILEHYEIM